MIYLIKYFLLFFIFQIEALKLIQYPNCIIVKFNGVSNIIMEDKEVKELESVTNGEKKLKLFIDFDFGNSEESIEEIKFFIEKFIKDDTLYCNELLKILSYEKSKLSPSTKNMLIYSFQDFFDIYQIIIFSDYEKEKYSHGIIYFFCCFLLLLIVLCCVFLLVKKNFNLMVNNNDISYIKLNEYFY